MSDDQQGSDSIDPERRNPSEHDFPSHAVLADDGFLLQALLETMPEFIFFKDAEHRFVRLSRSHLHFFNTDNPATVIGKSDVELFPPEIWHKSIAEEAQVLQGRAVIDREWESLTGDGRTVWVAENKIPIVDKDGEVIGLIGLTKDITRRVEAEQQVREREQRLQELVDDQQRLLQTIRELSTPVLPVYDQILVLPLVGTIDSTRSQQVLEALLENIVSYQAETVIIDISGVPVVDTLVANHLLQSTRAASLLGAHCVLVGVSSEVAQTIVQLGIDLADIDTRRTLQDGLEYALSLRGLSIEARTKSIES